MSVARIENFLRTIDESELGLCLRVNHTCRHEKVQKFFAFVSRLGNGVFWYALILILPLIYGASALPAAIHMSAVAIVGLLIYKVLKTVTVRRRPFVVHPGIQLGTAPLDQYSFPSGHTLHAASFTVVAVAYYGELAWVLVPFSLLVAASRVVLGLHYPSDVLAGALIGSTLAAVSLAL